MCSTVEKLKCKSKEGVFTTFFYNCEVNGDKTIFRVNVNENITDSEFFELHVVEFDANTVRISQIDNHYNPLYRAKGIPDALIPEIHCVLKKNIVSSSNKTLKQQREAVLKAETLIQEAEWRTVDANKVWVRLESKALAVYDKNEDRYRYKPKLLTCLKRWFRNNWLS